MDSDPQQCFVDQLQRPQLEVEIRVTEGITRGQGISSYIGYIIKVKQPTNISIQRRYSEFASLRQILVKRWPGVMIPCLPSKRTSGSNSLKVVNQRIKYLTYFLNGCARLKFIFQSDQFQIFLTSTAPDLRKLYQKMPALDYFLMLNRYQEYFPHLKPDQSKKMDMVNMYKNNIEPFIKMLQNQRISLINLKRQIFKLALKREKYVRASKILYFNTLPNFETHLLKTTQTVSLVLLHQNKQLKDASDDYKLASAHNYWLLFEAIKLQIGQSQAVVQALESKIDLERQMNNIAHQIVVNNQQISNIANKKMSLKQLFSRSNQDLLKQLQDKNKRLKQELQSLNILTLIVSEMTTCQLINNYQNRRENLWRNTFVAFLQGERQLATLLECFFSILHKC